MKRLMLAALVAISVSSCKKDSSSTSRPLEIEVSGMSSKTSISIRALDQNNREIINIENKFGSSTYSTQPVGVGDKIKVFYRSNVAPDLSGNGNGQLVFRYNGKLLLSAGGNLSYPKTNEVDIEIR